MFFSWCHRFRLGDKYLATVTKGHILKLNLRYILHWFKVLNENVSGRVWNEFGMESGKGLVVHYRTTFLFHSATRTEQNIYIQSIMYFNPPPPFPDMSKCLSIWNIFDNITTISKENQLFGNKERSIILYWASCIFTSQTISLQTAHAQKIR